MKLSKSSPVVPEKYWDGDLKWTNHHYGLKSSMNPYEMLEQDYTVTL